MISIHSWDKTTSGFGKRTAAILEFYFRFLFSPNFCHWHVILHWPAKFLQNRTTLGGVMTSYRFYLHSSLSGQVWYLRKALSIKFLRLSLSIKLARIRMNEGICSLQAWVVQLLIRMRQSRASSRPSSNSQWIKKYNISKTKPCMVCELWRIYCFDRLKSKGLNMPPKPSG